MYNKEAEEKRQIREHLEAEIRDLEAHVNTDNAIKPYVQMLRHRLLKLLIDHQRFVTNEIERVSRDIQENEG